MANELTLHADTGQTIYARVYNTSGQLWNGSAFETWNGANVDDYDIALTDRSSGIYQADFPAAASGIYYVAYFSQSGASPATDDYLVSANDRQFVWDGSAEVSLASMLLKLPSKAYLTGTDNADGSVELDDATGALSATAVSLITSAVLSVLNIYDDRAEVTLGGVYPVVQTESGGVYP